MACKYITDRLKGKGNVVIINGPPVSAVQNRVEGCQTEFKNIRISRCSRITRTPRAVVKAVWKS
jgi:ABC-type sugar transport system substrate-binding protein